MEDQIVQDIRLLQVILQENAAQGRIGDDILLDLLLGQNDVNRRVDVVVSQLEDILGQKLFRIRVYPPPAQAPVNHPAEKNDETNPSKRTHSPGPNKAPSTDQPPVAGPSGAKSRKLEPSTATKTPQDPRELTAQMISERLRQTIPNIHPIYAALKASEFALLTNPFDEVDRFFERLLARTDPLIISDMNWKPPDVLSTNHFNLFESVKKKFIEEKAQFLISSLPHVQPAYLEKIAQDLNGNDLRIQGFIVEVCEGNRVVPLINEENKQYSDIVEHFFTVEKFLEMYEDPLSHFKNDSRQTSEIYRNQALNQLKRDFRFASMCVLRKTFRENNYHYTPSYLKLNQEKCFRDRKTKRSDLECFLGEATDEFLLQEIAFVRIKQDLDAYLKNKEKLRLDAVQAARTRGALLDCPICCEDELVELDMIRCPNGHATCRQCVRKQSEELIGLMKNHVFCLDPNCGAEYSLRDLKGALTKTCFMHLEKRRQAEEIMEAGIDGLESCPFCEYCEVPPDNAFVFHCKKPGCLKASCRKCREPEHGQLRCEENAMKQRLANYVEIKMTEALVRECPTCKKKFVKMDGCNKMVCVCGTIICYICRGRIKDYKHFYNPHLPLQLQKQSDLSKCPLYSDTNKMHEEEVAKGAAQAKAELARQNPDVRVHLVLNKLN